MATIKLQAHRAHDPASRLEMEVLAGHQVDDEDDMGAPLPLREKIIAFMEMDDDHPYLMENRKAFRWAVAYQLLNLLLIGVSVIAFIVSTEPQYWDRRVPSLFALELISIIFFTFDYLIRFILSFDRRHWFFRFLNLIDLVSIAPFYVELIVAASSSETQLNAFIVIRVLRLFRVFRLFKMGKFASILVVAGQSLVASYEGFLLLVLMLSVSMIVFSAAVFFAEQTGSNFDFERRLWMYPNGEVSAFQSIAASMWWCVSTLLTIGYGDHVPQTPLGRFVGSLCMVFGVVLLAFPITIFGTNFATLYEHQQARRRAGAQSRRKPNATRMLMQIRIMNESIDDTLKDVQRKQRTLNLLLYKLSRHVMEEEGQRRDNKAEGDSSIYDDGVLDPIMEDPPSSDSDSF